MKKFKSLKVSVSMLVVVLLVSMLFVSMLFVSCGGGSLSCSLDDNDYFSQIGNVSVYFGVIMKHFADGEDLKLKLGHLGAASGMYLNKFEVGDTSQCWTIVSEICRSMGSPNIDSLQRVMEAKWNITIWADRNINNWYSPIQP